MKDYYDTDDRPVNDDTIDRFENRSRISLKDALGYDKDLLNRILNKDKLDEADKYNIASMYAECNYQYLECNNTHKEFEDFVIEVLGQETYNNLTSKWLQRKNNEMAKAMGCPELFNGKGIYFLK